MSAAPLPVVVPPSPNGRPRLPRRSATVARQHVILMRALRRAPMYGSGLEAEGELTHPQQAAAASRRQHREEAFESRASASAPWGRSDLWIVAVASCVVADSLWIVARWWRPLRSTCWSRSTESCPQSMCGMGPAALGASACGTMVDGSKILACSLTS